MDIDNILKLEEAVKICRSTIIWGSVAYANNYESHEYLGVRGPIKALITLFNDKRYSPPNEVIRLTLDYEDTSIAEYFKSKREQREQFNLLLRLHGYVVNQVNLARSAEQVLMLSHKELLDEARRKNFREYARTILGETK
jgi:hypothetical protein